MINPDDPYVLSLTGHRPNKLNGYNISTPYYHRLCDLLEHLIRTAISKHPNQLVVCHSGMALGADTVWACAILHVRDEFPEQVRFIADVPCRNQGSRWPEPSRRTLKTLLDRADSIITYSETYTPQCMQQRNIGMVDACDVLIAIWDGTTGGTANAVRYAQRIKKPILKIDPKTFEKSKL